MSLSRPATLLRLATGADLDLAAPDPALIDWPSLGLALARLPRWTGQTPPTRPAYSVAEHSLRCAWLAERLDYPLEYQLACLLHDAHEGYLGDMTRPVRSALARSDEAASEALRRLERRLQDAVCLASGLPLGVFAHELVELVDEAWLTVEAEEFFGLELGLTTRPAQRTYATALREARAGLAQEARLASWSHHPPHVLGELWSGEVLRLHGEIRGFGAAAG